MLRDHRLVQFVQFPVLPFAMISEGSGSAPGGAHNKVRPIPSTFLRGPSSNLRISSNGNSSILGRPEPATKSTEQPPLHATPSRSRSITPPRPTHIFTRSLAFSFSARDGNNYWRPDTNKKQSRINIDDDNKNRAAYHADAHDNPGDARKPLRRPQDSPGILNMAAKGRKGGNRKSAPRVINKYCSRQRHVTGNSSFLGVP